MRRPSAGVLAVVAAVAAGTLATCLLNASVRPNALDVLLPLAALFGTHGLAFAALPAAGVPAGLRLPLEPGTSGPVLVPVVLVLVPFLVARPGMGVVDLPAPGDRALVPLGGGPRRAAPRPW
ncbi:hypothetical protein [Nonomuraea sp. NPDC050783]|uniref:hypothetical protein n=1 Tax=Nonomuraea sp. NPDC050783 TaxID=3154634 RepID=UPI003466ACCD